MDRKKELDEQIDSLRQKMYTLYSHNNKDPEVLVVSQKLDRVLTLLREEPLNSEQNDQTENLRLDGRRE